MRQSLYGSPPNRTIYLDDVVCSGTEDNILLCPRISDNVVRNIIGESDCTHAEDAGIRCNGRVTFALTSLYPKQDYDVLIVSVVNKL